MNLKRAKAIGRLLLLFGMPAAVILGIFGGGVVCGNEYRHGITSFERDWLGLDVELAPAVDDDGGNKATDKSDRKVAEAEADEAVAKAEREAELAKQEAAQRRRDDVPSEIPAPQGAGPDAEQPTPRVTPPPKTEVPALTTVEPKPEPLQDPGSKAQPPPASLAIPEPLQGELAKKLAVPVVVQVKVLVDDQLIADNPAWIDYVQRTLSRASSVYKQQFGIELMLVSVGRWRVATEGMGPEELRAELVSHSREGADILLGFTGREYESLDDAVEQHSPAPHVNDGYGVVYAMPGQREPHLRSTLLGVGRSFGAREVVDKTSPAYNAASWMSRATIAPSQTLWIDGENRARILERKTQPFGPGPTPSTSPAPKASSEVPQ